ncbi:hypothetical protein CPAV1605_1186 [seawater metagenome]|uniref:Uncharacterized protein n=1 Tax=seawater metagenome TaxID=1561972 RepID=A0A5E8CLX7_9ZZZZ
MIKLMNYIFSQSLRNKSHLLKLFFLLILINLVYSIFSFLFFFIIKSVFPIIYVGGMLTAMNNYTKDKPLTRLINKIKNNDDPIKEKKEILPTTITRVNDIFSAIPEIKLA